MFDDITLIQLFIQGRLSLESNSNLRVESNLDSVQLLTKKGAFLAVVKLAHKVRAVLVRQESQYWDLMSQLLVENNFMPVGSNEQGLMCYEYRPIPAGYAMKYTEAKLLWKAWRSQLHQRSPQAAQQNPLIHTPEGWQLIQGITTSQELLFVQTLTQEVMIHGSDCIVWLSPAQDQPETAIFDGSPSSQENGSVQPAKSVFESLQVLSQAIRFRGGKLYIQTGQGEIVVEGSNLKFWLQANSAQDDAAPTPLPHEPIEAGN